MVKAAESLRTACAHGRPPLYCEAPRKTCEQVSPMDFFEYLENPRVRAVRYSRCIIATFVLQGSPPVFEIEVTRMS